MCVCLQLDSGLMVCDMVRKWDLVYQSETSLIMDNQMTGLTNWLSTYVDQVRLSQPIQDITSAVSLKFAERKSIKGEKLVSDELFKYDNTYY